MAETPSDTAILVVDDSSSMRDMVKFILESAGYKVTVAEDGLEGLEHARSDVYRLIVTDINMPNMDGFTLISELRKMDSYRFTPILTLTTETGADAKAKARDAGATGWIVKPFDPAGLVKSVQRVI